MHTTKAEPVILDMSQVDLTLPLDDLPPELEQALHRVLAGVEGVRESVSLFTNHISAG